MTQITRICDLQAADGPRFVDLGLVDLEFRKIWSSADLVFGAFAFEASG